MKSKTGKLLSFLLTLAMVVGLVPGLSLTAYANTSIIGHIITVYIKGDEWWLRSSTNDNRSAIIAQYVVLGIATSKEACHRECGVRPVITINLKKVKEGKFSNSKYSKQTTVEQFFSRLNKEDRVLLEVDIQSDPNLFFSKYDIAVLMDGKQKFVMKNGSKYIGAIRVFAGKHELKFSSIENPEVSGSIEVEVFDHSLLNCTVYSHRNEINITLKSMQSYKEIDNSLGNEDRKKLYSKLRLHFDKALKGEKHLGKGHYVYYTVLFSEETGEAVLIAQTGKSFSERSSAASVLFGITRKGKNNKPLFVSERGATEDLNEYTKMDIKEGCKVLIDLLSYD